MSDDNCGPLTSYMANLRAKLSLEDPVRARAIGNLLTKAHAIGRARTAIGVSKAAVGFRKWVDEHHDEVRSTCFPDTPSWTAFRGNFLEESAMLLANAVTEEQDLQGRVVVDKLGSGDGVLTGISLAYSKRQIGEPVKLQFSRDREDVIVGVRRTIRVENVNKAGKIEEVGLQDELIPLCVIACKVYIDATRLENVIAKARSIKSMYSSCTFLVCSEWDGLGEADWHDSEGGLLDSRVVPVDGIVFLRGDDVRRPNNDMLKEASEEHPLRKQQFARLQELIEKSLEPWIEAV